MARWSREKRVEDLERARAIENARLRAWRERNPAQYRKQNKNALRLVDEATLAAMTASQHGLCAICERQPGDCLDHCHATNSVRALLCRNCNAGLGQFYDRAELLEVAAAYVERLQTKEATE